MSLGRREIDLTEGSIWKQLVRFTLPLLIGNIFQQMYNTVDSLVLGRYVGTEALAAVGSCGNAINALIGFFIGIATGAGVIISQFCGAKDDENLSKAVQTTVTVALIACVVCTTLGLAAITPLMKFMKMNKNPDVAPMMRSYLKIYFSGITGLLLYNIGAGILRAVGDSKRPLYFLIITTVMNTALDLIFVTVFEWGVDGVAYATIISQFISAILVLVVLTASHANYRIRWNRLGLEKRIVAAIFKIGLPGAIQSAITSFSNVFVQGYINNFGKYCMAGWAAYGKIDQFALLPVNSLGIAATTFSGQNLGAGKVERAKKGLSVAMGLSAFICVVMCIPMILFRRNLIGIFDKTEEVLEFGSTFLMMMSPFYFFCAVNNVYAGVLRGAGISMAPMIFMLSSFVAFRQIYLFVFSHITESFLVVALAYPMGWILCATLLMLYYKFGKWENKSAALVRAAKG